MANFFPRCRGGQGRRGLFGRSPAGNFRHLLPAPRARHTAEIGIGGHLAMPPLPHHRAYGSVPRRFGGFRSFRFCRPKKGRQLAAAITFCARSRPWVDRALPALRAAHRAVAGRGHPRQRLWPWVAEDREADRALPVVIDPPRSTASRDHSPCPASGRARVFLRYHRNGIINFTNASLHLEFKLSWESRGLAIGTDRYANHCFRRQHVFFGTSHMASLGVCRCNVSQLDHGNPSRSAKALR